MGVTFDLNLLEIILFFYTLHNLHPGCAAVQESSAFHFIPSTDCGCLYKQSGRLVSWPLHVKLNAISRINFTHVPPEKDPVSGSCFWCFILFLSCSSFPHPSLRQVGAGARPIHHPCRDTAPESEGDVKLLWCLFWCWFPAFSLYLSPLFAFLSLFKC